MYPKAKHGGWVITGEYSYRGIFLFSETIAVPTFEFSDVAMCEQSEGDIMSLDQAKKVIAEKLQSDAGLRDRVVDFILYRGFLLNFENLKEVWKEVQAQCNEEYGHDSHLSRQNGQERPCNGYEYWVG